MITSVYLLEEFKKLGVLNKGHFVLNSWRHSADFVLKDRLLSDPQIFEELAASVFSRYREGAVGGVLRDEPEVVAAPAVGAIPFGFELAQCWGVPFIYAEKVGEGEWEFGRGFKSFINPGTKVLLAEDVITTGKTVKEMIQAIEKLGGIVVRVVPIWLRGDNDITGYKVTPCVDVKLPSWDENDCPLCKSGEEVTLGLNKHGLEFCEKYGTDPVHWPANI